MNTFQWLTVPVLSLLAIIDAVAVCRRPRVFSLMRLLIWLSAAGLILFPQTTSAAARVIGIGRGTDLVFYLFMLTTTFVMFHFYGRQFTLYRDLVQLARLEAIRNPIAGKGLGSGSSQTTIRVTPDVDQDPSS